MSEYHFTDCKWLSANHFLFQIANVCLAASYLAPDSLNGLFMLRGALGLGGLFFALWGWWILCAPDTFVWNVLFMVFNFGHLAYLIYKVKRPRRFSSEAESVYIHLFEPLGVERYQFQKIANLSSASTIQAGEFYGRENTPVERVSILLSGGVEAKKGGKLLHAIREYEFLDSPEWAVFRAGEISRYGVTLIAKEDCKFLTWKSTDLRRMLQMDPLMKNVFNSLVGQDVTQKLLSLDRSYETPSSPSAVAKIYGNQDYIGGYLNAFSEPQQGNLENVGNFDATMEKVPLLGVKSSDSVPRGRSSGNHSTESV